MLKIKDNVDLKELEKYGFELDERKKYYQIIITSFPLGDYQPSERNYLSVNVESKKIFNHIWGITWQSDHYSFEYSDTLYDLIKDGLVEKVNE